MARTQTVHKLVYQKYVVKEVNGKREITTAKQRRPLLVA